MELVGIAALAVVVLSSHVHLVRLIRRLTTIQERIMTTQADLDAVVDQLNTTAGEIEQEIADLKAANPDLDLTRLNDLATRLKNDVPPPAGP